MKQLIPLLLSSILLFSCAPRNPHSPEAQRLLALLDSLNGHKTLSATMSNVSWNIAEAQLVHDTTGKWPAIIGLDFIDIYTDLNPDSSAPHPYDNFDLPLQWHRDGGLITICWHWFVPVAPDSARLTFRPDTRFQVANMLTPGTWEHSIMSRDLQLIAHRLSQFRDAHIPILWRPLHEAAGNTIIGGDPWFWWGNGGPDNYVALWRHMHDYFDSLHLDNLIYLWTTETGIHADSLAFDTPWYPGDDYVDIICRDSYHKNASQCLAEYNAIRQTYPQKPLTLSECGQVAPISQQWQQGAHWAWFMPWYTYNASSLRSHDWADASWWLDAANNPNVLWRHDLPKH